ncbi:MAG: heme exporter protein B [bacterium]|nr:MAG: heme exporter protein B [bacterium]
MRFASWLSRTAAIAAKDARAELRTRHALNAVLLFALSSLVAVSMSLAGARPGPEILASLLWILMVFAALAGLPRSFVHEEERQTAAWLKLSATPAMVYCGKFAFNLVLLVLVQLVIVPAFLVLLRVTLVHPASFFLAIALGSLGLAAAGTLVAAIVARTRNRGSLFAALAFPLLLPLLVAGTIATRESLTPGTAPMAWGELRVLLSYAVVVFTGGLLLFEFVWND